MISKKINIFHSVIVFDLDDTLYKEKNYQISGFREVSNYLKKNYKIKNSYNFMLSCMKKKKNVLEELCVKFDLNRSILKSLIWVYRLHKPKIYLKKSIKNTLKKLEKSCAGVVILTDGRSITQRLKLSALGIAYLPFYISEDYNDTKPSLKRFKLIMKEFSARDFIYIGDNPSKDFIAPKKLKWFTIGIRGDKNNIHPQKFSNKKSSQPDFWIEKLQDILKYI